MQLSEHVKDPQKLVLEVYKALKFEGEVFLTVPFMYPYNEARIDLIRWTQEELKNLMIEFTPIRVGILVGLTTNFVEALNGWMSFFLTFNSDRLCQVVCLILLPLLKSFQIIDRFF
jgi:hypothetical protein